MAKLVSSVLACCLTASALVAAPAGASPPAVSIEVDFEDCTEMIGVEIVADSLAADVPEEFGLGFFGPPVPDSASLIVRTARCDHLEMWGHDLGAVTVAQVGVITALTDAELDDGDADGDGIDNYTLAYATDSLLLALALRLGGVPAVWDRHLDFEVTTDGTTASVAGGPIRQPRYQLSGSQPDVFPGVGGFLAHWWADGRSGRVRMRTAIDAIDFGFDFSGAGVEIDPGPGSMLEHFLGSAPVAFDVGLIGRFAEGHMDVEVAAIGS